MQEHTASGISKELYQEIELQINQNLFSAGYITQEMFERANILILKGKRSQHQH